ncbi:unnamed protein product, partial [Didymodactylos carnosus]
NKSRQRLTLCPRFFNLKDELSNILQNDNDIKKKLAAILTTNIESKEVDLNANLNKIVELLEPVLLDRLNERLNHLGNLIAKIEEHVDDSERYSRSFNIRLLNVPYSDEEDPIGITTDIAFYVTFVHTKEKKET